MNLRQFLRALGWLVSELIPAQAVRVAQGRDWSAAERLADVEAEVEVWSAPESDGPYLYWPAKDVPTSPPGVGADPEGLEPFPPGSPFRVTQRTPDSEAQYPIAMGSRYHDCPSDNREREFPMSMQHPTTHEAVIASLQAETDPVITQSSVLADLVETEGLGA